MLEPEDRNEIIGAFRHEFKEFRTNKIDPLCNTVDEVGKRVIKHGEQLAANKSEIGSNKDSIEENATAIRGKADNKLVFWLLGISGTIGSAIILYVILGA